MVNKANLGHILVGQDRVFHLDLVATLRPGVEQIAFGAHHHLCAGNEFFTNGVNRRVGDLSKELFKVVVQEFRFVGQDGQWHVVPHSADGFNAVLGHWPYQHAQFLKGIAKRLLAFNHRSAVGFGHLVREGRGQVVQRHLVFIQPFPVWVFGGYAIL